MRQQQDIGLPQIQDVYTGPEGRLWELLMGEQIHVGGLTSSLKLAEKAGIDGQKRGVDLCCCTAAGMRFLLRMRRVAHMDGVDATDAMIELGRQRCGSEGLSDRATLVGAEATDTGLDGDAYDFVWGEDAWCYVADKQALIAEAVRLTRPGGTIAFTDWCEGPNALTDPQAERLMRFMKFPSFATPGDYAGWLEAGGCEVGTAEDTGRFPACIDLYLKMVQQQLTYDALKLLGFDRDALDQIAGEMMFVRELVHSGSVIQARIIARKKG